MKDLVFDENGWMARCYQRYVQLGGRSRHPENLCRFVRVVFIWSPLRRFFKGTAPLDCTPFGFIALCFFAIFILLIAGWLGHHFLFENWLAGLVFLWLIWIGFVFAGTMVWADEGGLERLAEKCIEPIHALQSYRQARASLFCPLIKFERKTK